MAFAIAVLKLEMYPTVLEKQGELDGESALSGCFTE
jgi:hypothetical protein